MLTKQASGQEPLENAILTREHTAVSEARRFRG